MKKLFISVGLIIAGVFSSCKKDERNITQFDSDNIQAYISSNNLQMTQFGSTGAYYQITSAPTGQTLNYSDRVFMTYTVKTLDGRIVSNDLNQNRYTGYLGYLERNNLYGGYPTIWRTILKEALQKKGGSIRMIVPSAEAFGNKGYEVSQSYMSQAIPAFNGIPGNASLDCTINLSTANNITEFEDTYVQQYINANNITGLSRTKEGLYYQIITQGSGGIINPTSTVTATYTGKLTSGATFDSATGTSFDLTGVIAGWQIGIPLIQKGGKIRLIIPPNLGYGPNANANGTIPPNAILDFDITVTEVTN